MNRANEAEMQTRFSGNLWWLRNRRKLSQEALAQLAEIHRTQISLLEGGKRSPLLPTILTLAGALDVPVQQLTEGITYVPPARGLAGHYLVEPLIMPSIGEIR